MTEKQNTQNSHLSFSNIDFILIFIARLLEERMTKTVERDSLNSYKIES